MTTLQIFLVCFFASATVGAVTSQICTAYLIAKGKHPTYNKSTERKE